MLSFVLLARPFRCAQSAIALVYGNRVPAQAVGCLYQGESVVAVWKSTAPIVLNPESLAL